VGDRQSHNLSSTPARACAQTLHRFDGSGGLSQTSLPELDATKFCHRVLAVLHVACTSPPVCEASRLNWLQRRSVSPCAWPPSSCVAALSALPLRTPGHPSARQECFVLTRMYSTARRGKGSFQLCKPARDVVLQLCEVGPHGSASVHLRK